MRTIATTPPTTAAPTMTAALPRPRYLNPSAVLGRSPTLAITHTTITPTIVTSQIMASQIMNIPIVLTQRFAIFLVQQASPPS